MESLGKQVGFLKGLIEGMPEETMKTLDGKLIKGIVDLLGALSDRADTVDEMLSELNDYVESIDDDLSELEGGQDDDDYDEDLFEDGEDEDAEDGFAEDQLHLLKTDDDEMTLAGGICPACKGVFFFEGDDEASYVCPHCGKTVSPTPLKSDNTPMGKPV